MTKIIMVHDLPDDPDNPDGPTIKEANLKKQHKYPIGTLVEVKYDDWFGEGACAKVHARLWVVNLGRDCDGTPLYSVGSLNPKEWFGGIWGEFDLDKYKRIANVCKHCLGEEQLTPVEITEELKKGYDALEWEEEDG